MGARARPRRRPLRGGAARRHRAGRRDRARRARGDDRGPGRAAAHRPARRAAALDRRRAGGSNGRTARSATPSRPRTPSSCAGRNSTPPGATSSPSGATPTPTFDMLQFGLRLGRAPAPARHHHAAADRADQAADRRSAHRGDARRRRTPTPRYLVAGLPRRGDRRAMPARGSAARRSTARSSRSAPTRCGRAR